MRKSDTRHSETTIFFGDQKKLTRRDTVDFFKLIDTSMKDTKITVIIETELKLSVCLYMGLFKTE